MNLFGDSFTRWRGRQTTDKYGNTITVWDDTGKLTISGVSVQPAYSKAAYDLERVIGILGLTIIGPPGVDLDVSKNDRFLYGEVNGVGSGNWFIADGEIVRYFVGGVLHHVVIRVKRAA